MGLVLMRLPGESIAIGNDVLIQVVQVVGNKVRLFIDAPDSTSIMRLEILPEGKYSDAITKEAASAKNKKENKRKRFR